MDASIWFIVVTVIVIAFPLLYSYASVKNRTLTKYEKERAKRLEYGRSDSFEYDVSSMSLYFANTEV